MINAMLISALVRGAWAIEPKAAQAYMPLVKALLAKDYSSIPDIKTKIGKKKYNAFEKISAVELKGGIIYGYEDMATAPKGSVAVINFRQPIMKYDTSFGYGTKSRVDQIDRKSTRLNSSHSDRSRMPSSA